MGRQRSGRAPAARPTGADSGVGRAEVRDDPSRPGVRVLSIDGHIHGAVNLANASQLELDYLARLAALAEALGPFPGRVVHLGGGAFALPRAMAARSTAAGHGPGDHLVVETSRSIIKLAREELGLRETAGIAVRKGDARAVVSRLEDSSVAMVIGDAFVGSTTPRHLQTVEFLEDIARVLVRGGFYVANLVDEAPYPVLAAHAATALSVFSSVFAVAAAGVAKLRDPGNVLLVATNRRVALEELGHRVAVGANPSTLVRPGRLSALAGTARPRHDSDG